MEQTYDKNIVKAAADGRWEQIFSSLAPELSAAMERPGRHVPCPIHGGVDGFRLFPDYNERGSGVCNTCGVKGDGIEMLMWLHNWSFKETVRRIAECLGVRVESNVVSTTDEDKEYRGRILYLGESDGKFGPSYVVRLEDENGKYQRCWGKGLKKAAEEAGLKRGDNALLKLVCSQVIKRRNGSTYTKKFWTAKKLESDEQKKVRLEKEHDEQERRRSAVINTWKEAKPLEWDKECPVTRYLKSRGISFDKDTGAKVTAAVRYEELLEYCKAYDDKEYLPGMVSLVTDINGKAVSIHRTYLTKDGKKADVECVKKLMPVPADRKLLGAAVRLGGEVEDVLCLTEGVETALSVCIGTGFPCWAAVSAQGLEHVRIPESVKTVFIFADKDKTETGQKSAEVLRQRLSEEGVLAAVMLPTDAIPEGSKGIDWNDVLVSGKVFPVKKCTAVKAEEETADTPQ